MQMRRLLSLICASALLITSGLVYITATRSSVMGSAELEKRFAWVDACLENPDQVVSGLTGMSYEKSAGDRAICAANSLGNVASIEERVILIDELLQRAQKNEEIRQACHNILHEIGREAWEYSKKDSLILGYETCGMGYYHGAFTTSLANGGENNNLSYLLNFCKRLAKSTELTNGMPNPKKGEIFYNNVKNALCMHGVGHALAGIGKTIKEGYQVCSKVTGYNPKEDPSICFGGFLNEYMITHATKEKDPNKAVEPCSAAELEGLFIKECVKYMLTKNDIPSANTRFFCAQQSKEWALRGCWAAVGWIGGIKELLVGTNTEAGKDLLRDPTGFARYVESVCAGDTTFECDDHLFSEVGQTVLDSTLMLSICEKLSVLANRERCTKNIQGLSGVQGIEFTNSQQKDIGNPITIPSSAK